MTTIAVFGGTGYVGGHIRDEALRRGHTVISVSRSIEGFSDKPNLVLREGDIHDGPLVDHIASEADVLAVAIRASAADGVPLVNAIPSLARAASEHSNRIGVVGGAGSLRVSDDGPRIVDLPGFPAEHKPEALGQAAVLDALRATSDLVNWFYLSPAADFGSAEPGTATGKYRVGGDVMLTDASGRSYISGADYATAFVDEIEKPEHHRTRFTVGY